MKKCIFVFLASFIFIMGVFTPVHVNAADNEILEVPIFTRDNYLIYPTMTGSETATDYVITTFETKLQYTIETLEPGYTYSSDSSVLLDYITYYHNYTNENITIITDVQDVRISLNNGNEYYTDFYYNDKHIDVIEPGVNTSISEDFYVDVDITDFFTDTWSDIQITVTLQHYIWHYDISNIYSIYTNASVRDNTNIQFTRFSGQYVGNWFSELKSSMQSAFATLFGKVDSGFYALYNQMTNEQDEKLNGYDGTVASGANNEFQSGAEDLTQIEGQLNTNSTTYVNDFTSSGFDTGILTTLGSSLTFVVTWFTNFWNMGGIWTVGLSTCFAIWIAFYILRTRSK